MTRNEIMNDMAFRQQCGKYGLDWDNFEIYDFEDVILLNTPIKDLYVMFDKNYNTIDIVSGCSTKDKRAIVMKKIYDYNHLTSLYYPPFRYFTLKQIIDIANRIEIDETNHGNSLRTKINGELFNRQSEEADYYQLLSYIKFLGEEIKRYFSLSYQLKALGFDAPTIYAYLNNLIDRINNSIKVCIANNQRPRPSDVLKNIGQNHREYDVLLYDIIDLLMRDQGYKVSSKNYNEIEAFAKSRSESYLIDLSSQILKIVNKTKLGEDRPWLELEEDIEEDVEPPAGPKQS